MKSGDHHNYDAKKNIVSGYDLTLSRIQMEQSRYSEKVSTCRKSKVVSYHHSSSIHPSIHVKNVMEAWPFIILVFILLIYLSIEKENSTAVSLYLQ